MNRALKAGILLAALAAVVVFTPGPLADRPAAAIRDVFRSLFVFALTGVAAAWLIVFLDKTNSRAVYRMLSGADYDAALRRCARLLWWFPNSAHFLFLRGTALLFSGRLDEAERELRHSLEKGAGPAQSSRLVNLGYIQMDKGQFRDAIATFERAAAIFSASGTAYGALADARLRGDIEPEKALALLDRGIKLRLGNPRFRTMDRHTLAYMWADRAWALARDGRPEEAQEDIEKALEEADPGFAPGFAGSLWRVGLAMQALGRADDARRQFLRAAQADPRGTYGKRSAEAARAELS